MHILRTRSEPSEHLWVGQIALAVARCAFSACEANPLRTLGGSNRSRCGAVRILSVQKCGSAVLLNQKRASKVLLRSVDQKQCGSEVLMRRVPQQCWSEVSIRCVAQKCRSEVLLRLRSVDQKKCGSEVLIRCFSTVSLRSVNQKWCSNVSLRSLVRAGKSQLCSASLAREVQVSSSSLKIVTL